MSGAPPYNGRAKLACRKKAKASRKAPIVFNNRNCERTTVMASSRGNFAIGVRQLSRLKRLVLIAVVIFPTLFKSSDANDTMGHYGSAQKIDKLYGRPNIDQPYPSHNGHDLTMSHRRSIDVPRKKDAEAKLGFAHHYDNKHGEQNEAHNGEFHYHNENGCPLALQYVHWPNLGYTSHYGRRLENYGHNAQYGSSQYAAQPPGYGPSSRSEYDNQPYHQHAYDNKDYRQISYDKKPIEGYNSEQLVVTVKDTYDLKAFRPPKVDLSELIFPADDYSRNNYGKSEHSYDYHPSYNNNEVPLQPPYEGHPPHYDKEHHDDYAPQVDHPPPSGYGSEEKYDSEGVDKFGTLPYRVHEKEPADDKNEYEHPPQQPTSAQPPAPPPPSPSEPHYSEQNNYAPSDHAPTPGGYDNDVKYGKDAVDKFGTLPYKEHEEKPEYKKNEYKHPPQQLVPSQPPAPPPSESPYDGKHSDYNKKQEQPNDYGPHDYSPPSGYDNNDKYGKEGVDKFATQPYKIKEKPAYKKNEYEHPPQPPAPPPPSPPAPPPSIESYHDEEHSHHSEYAPHKHEEYPPLAPPPSEPPYDAGHSHHSEYASHDQVGHLQIAQSSPQPEAHYDGEHSDYVPQKNVDHPPQNTYDQTTKYNKEHVGEYDSQSEHAKKDNVDKFGVLPYKEKQKEKLSTTPTENDYGSAKEQPKNERDEFGVLPYKEHKTEKKNYKKVDDYETQQQYNTSRNDAHARKPTLAGAHGVSGVDENMRERAEAEDAADDENDAGEVNSDVEFRNELDSVGDIDAKESPPGVNIVSEDFLKGTNRRGKKSGKLRKSSENQRHEHDVSTHSATSPTTTSAASLNNFSANVGEHLDEKAMQLRAKNEKTTPLAVNFASSVETTRNSSATVSTTTDRFTVMDSTPMQTVTSNSVAGDLKLPSTTVSIIDSLTAENRSTTVDINLQDELEEKTPSSTVLPLSTSGNFETTIINTPSTAHSTLSTEVATTTVNISSSSSRFTPAVLKRSEQVNTLLSTIFLSKTTPFLDETTVSYIVSTVGSTLSTEVEKSTVNVDFSSSERNTIIPKRRHGLAEDVDEKVEEKMLTTTTTSTTTVPENNQSTPNFHVSYLESSTLATSMFTPSNYEEDNSQRMSTLADDRIPNSSTTRTTTEELTTITTPTTIAEINDDEKSWSEVNDVLAERSDELSAAFVGELNITEDAFPLTSTTNTTITTPNIATTTITAVSKPRSNNNNKRAERHAITTTTTSSESIVTQPSGSAALKTSTILAKKFFYGRNADYTSDELLDDVIEEQRRVPNNLDERNVSVGLFGGTTNYVSNKKLQLKNKPKETVGMKSVPPTKSAEAQQSSDAETALADELQQQPLPMPASLPLAQTADEDNAAASTPSQSTPSLATQASANESMTSASANATQSLATTTAAIAPNTTTVAPTLAPLPIAVETVGIIELLKRAAEEAKKLPEPGPQPPCAGTKTPLGECSPFFQCDATNKTFTCWADDTMDSFKLLYDPATQSCKNFDALKTCSREKFCANESKTLEHLQLLGGGNNCTRLAYDCTANVDAIICTQPGEVVDPKGKGNCVPDSAVAECVPLMQSIMKN